MASSLTSLTEETQLGTGISDLVTTTATQKTFIGKATFTNTSSSVVTVTVWRLLDATTETTGSGGNWIAEEKIAPGKQWECLEIMGHALGNSMKISASASVGSVVNVDISGTVDP